MRYIVKAVPIATDFIVNPAGVGIEVKVVIMPSALVDPVPELPLVSVPITFTVPEPVNTYVVLFCIPVFTNPQLLFGNLTAPA
jgi:hypothetical protein